MRAAMAAAPVGDDQYGEDPTVNALQERVAALLGKEAALLLPSGTMANQVALRALTRPGDDVIVSRESHAVWHEMGGSAANAGVQFTEIGARGVFTADEVLAAIKPRGHLIYPPTTLVEVENTHNRSGGIVVAAGGGRARVRRRARARHRDAFSTARDCGTPRSRADAREAELAAPFDLVAVSLSKGLGAPGGSLLAGSRATIDLAVRYRRMFGGAMRQVGHPRRRGPLRARPSPRRGSPTTTPTRGLIAERLAQSPRVDARPRDRADQHRRVRPARRCAGRRRGRRGARAKGVLVFAFGPRTVRAVTHLDVTREQCVEAARDRSHRSSTAAPAI